MIEARPARAWRRAIHRSLRQLPRHQRRSRQQHLPRRATRRCAERRSAVQGYRDRRCAAEQRDSVVCGAAYVAGCGGDSGVYGESGECGVASAGCAAGVWMMLRRMGVGSCLAASIQLRIDVFVVSTGFQSGMWGDPDVALRPSYDRKLAQEEARLAFVRLRFDAFGQFST